jgi:hypothetical protein
MAGISDDAWIPAETDGAALLNDVERFLSRN